MRLVTDDQRKLGYLNDKVKQSATNDPKYRQWHSGNSMVTTSLINSIDPVVRIANSSFAAIVGKGIVSIPSFLNLEYVMYVLNLLYNLLTISKLTLGHNC